MGSCEEDRNPQPTFLGLNLNLKMVWRAVKLATGCFHFFHQSSGSPGVLGVPESWESRESRSLGSLGSPGVSNCKLYLCRKLSNFRDRERNFSFYSRFFSRER